MTRSSANPIRSLAPFLVVALGAAALYVPPLLHGGVLYGYDTVHEVLYRRIWGFGELRAGRLPLWNPHILAGVPFFSDTTMGMAYPPNLALYLLLPAPLAINLTIALHVLLAGAGMLAFLRSGLRLGAAPSVLGGLSYMLGAFMTGHVFLGSIEHLVACAWWPIGFLCVEKAISGRSLKPALAGAFVLAASIAGGHLQFVYLGVLAWAMYALARALVASGESAPKAILRAARPLAIMTIGGALLAAFALLPMAGLYRDSIRAGGVDPGLTLSGATLPPWQAVNLIAPTFFGDTIATPYWGYMGQEMVTAYLGLLPLLLAFLVSPSKESRAAVRFFQALALFGLVMAFGRYTPLMWLVHHLLPFAGGFRHPARWLGFFAFGASVAGAAGLESVLGDGARPVRHLRGAAAVLFVAALVLLATLFRTQPSTPPAWFDHFQAWAIDRVAMPAGKPPNGPLWVAAAYGCTKASVVRAAFLLAGILAWTVLARRAGERGRPIVGILAIAIAFADLAGYAARYLVTVDPRDYLWGPEVAEKLTRPESEPFRIATLFSGAAIPYPGQTGLTHGRVNRFSESHAHRSMAARLSNIGGAGSMMPRGYRDLVLGFEAVNFADGFVRSRSILDLLNVRTLLVPAGEPPPWKDEGGWTDRGAVEGMQVWENEQALPRAFFPERVRWQSAPRIDPRDEGFDPRREAVLEGPSPRECRSSDALEAPPGAAAGTATFRHYTSRDVELEVTSPEGGWLVLTDADSPGWRATVNEKPTPIVRADLAFRAVCVPAGQSDVHFRYEPVALEVGAAISVLSIPGILFFLVREGGRESRMRCRRDRTGTAPRRAD